MLDLDKYEAKYQKIVRTKPQVESKQFEDLFEWEVEMFERILDRLNDDKEAQALIGHTLHYALTQSYCNQRAH